MISLWAQAALCGVVALGVGVDNKMPQLHATSYELLDYIVISLLT